MKTHVMVAGLLMATGWVAQATNCVEIAQGDATLQGPLAQRFATLLCKAAWDESPANQSALAAETANASRFVDLAQRCVPLTERDTQAGEAHDSASAREMIRQCLALAEYAVNTADTNLLHAAVATAWDVVEQEITLAGSGASCGRWYHGAQHQHENFLRPQETDVTIAWLRLCEKMLVLTAEARWADQFERTFYNAYLGALSPDGQRFASYTPLNGSRGEVSPQNRFAEVHGAWGIQAFLRSILTARANEVFVNHYVPSRVAITVPALGEKAIFEMHTTYPKAGAVDLRYCGTKPLKFRLSVRVPRGAMLGATVKVNGQDVTFAHRQSGAVVTRYVTMLREWQPGDAVSLNLPCKVEAHRLGNALAFTRGPILLARDSRFDDGELDEVLCMEDSARIGEGFREVHTVLSNEMAMTMAADFYVGSGEANAASGRRVTVHFCDYASAGNRWRTDNAYRTWLPVGLRACATRPTKPDFDRAKFIVASTGFAGIKNPTEQDVQRLVDCGIDLMCYGNVKTQVLDWFAKHSIACIRAWTMPGDWWWFDSDPKKKFKNGERWHGWDMDRLRAYFDMTQPHPAVKGVSIWDEPNARDYPFLGKVVRTAKERFPDKFLFLNLFPIYALPDNAGVERARLQLGTDDYESYVAEYCRHIPLDYISYDFYPYAWNVTARQFYDNLRIVADACSATGKSHWLYLQCTRYNQDKKERYPIIDEPRLRYQAATALAYGAECIIWACWAPSWTGWDVNVVDADGRPTAVYEPLKKVNAALHAIGPEYMKYRRLTTDLVGVEGELAESSGTAFAHVKATDGAALAVGHFAARSGKGDYALFIAAIDDPNGVKQVDHTITFTLPRKGFKLRAHKGSGAFALMPTAENAYALHLTTGHGVLITAERP